MPTWPATLPKPESEGFQETPPFLAIRTQMDAGPAKVRKQFTAGVRLLTCSYRLTWDELTTLDSFFMNDCDGGSVAFGFTHPRTGASVSARFTEQPTYEADSGSWRVTVKLEILP